jgi:hypothetical protein
MCSALWTLERLDLAGAHVLGGFCWVKAWGLTRDETDGNHEANGIAIAMLLGERSYFGLESNRGRWDRHRPGHVLMDPAELRAEEK